MASTDADASAAGIKVLRDGGNAVDAAVATAAALGVTEPYSSGIGGGGYFVYYDAAERTVASIDGRETAPGSANSALFVDRGRPIPLDAAMTSGLAVGAPGTPATWQQALRAWGTRSLQELLAPAEKLARDGFTVDATFSEQTRSNAARFADFPATAKLFLPGGKPPAVGSVLRNPDLARTYQELGLGGVGAFYRGPIGRDIVAAVRRPPVARKAHRTVRPGQLTAADLRGYAVRRHPPTVVTYRGRHVYSVAPSSSGGTAVGEALNILQTTKVAKLSQSQYLHRFLEASRIAFADRDRWIGDPAFVNVPTTGLLAPGYAASRACLINPAKALRSPLAPGNPDKVRPCAGLRSPVRAAREGLATTHLTTADRWGNVVSYTLTIQQIGGSAITVPGRGFLLNNELTDFDFVPMHPGTPDPNLPGPGKRPRSAMSPTIVLDHGRLDFALGSPGGPTIITTVLQILTEHIDRSLTMPEAITAPRASQRNTATTEAEPAFLASPWRAELAALGHAFTRTPEIGDATAVQRLPSGGWLAAAEPVRRGGGSAMVVTPDPRAAAAGW